MNAQLPAIPGYACERLLGAGAHARVYLAREPGGLRRPVALKVFFPWQREKFARELEMVRAVEELRRRERALEIVQSLGASDGAGPDLWIALEHMERGSLADAVARAGPLPLEEALARAAETARALVLLHRAGLFHRDVKPQNVLLGADGRARLADFGLARPLAGTLSAAGSPAFAAPEAIAGRLADGRLADVYSIGATLAFALTGEVMLPGRPDVFALERRGVPRPLQQTIVAAMAAEPRDRLASIEAFIDGLGFLSRMKSTSRDGDVKEVDDMGGRAPKGWLLAGSHPGEYETGVDAAVAVDGKSAAFLRSRTAAAGEFGTLMQQVKAGAWRGKRARLAASVRAEGVAGWAGLWMRVDGPGAPPEALAFDNMEDRPVRGTAPFARHEVVLDVPEEAVGVAFGILLDGPGAVWIGGVTLEAVGPEVPVTSDFPAGGEEDLPEEPRLDFEA